MEAHTRRFQMKVIRFENKGSLVDTESDEALIYAINAAHKAKEWEFYSELKKEFYKRLESDKTLAPRAEDIAHKAGLITF
jgi:hypothetical protein